MRKIFFASVALLLSLTVKCQYSPAPGKLQLIAEYQDLYTTHRDHFRGVSFIVAKAVSPWLRLGAGAEYSAHSYHFDNDWNLYHLHFIPVFVDEQLKLKNSRRLFPVIHLSEGLTYSSYQKEVIADPGRIQTIHEVGVYLYGGTGVTYRVSNKVGVSVEAGMKGFHNSFNDLDVNPHGITGRLGIILSGL